MEYAKQWLLIDPLDTLFFRGSDPMVAGETHEVRSVFPPMPSTLIGSLCTAVLTQREIKVPDYTGPGGPTQEVKERFPLLGVPGKPEFDVSGPIFRVSLRDGVHEWFVPAPAHWFGQLPACTDCECSGHSVSVAVGQDVKEEFGRLGLKGSVSNPLWIAQPVDRAPKSLWGLWINPAAVENVAQGKSIVYLHTSLDYLVAGSATVVSLKLLFANELRVGIALERKTRRVRTGHLYSASHARLHSGVQMVVGLSHDLVPHHLDARGILQLGGEQRIARYELLPECPPLPLGNSGWIMTLNAIPFTRIQANGWDPLPRASGPLLRVAGWDIKERFHKPTTTFLPPGTVVKTNADHPVPFGFISLP